MLVLKLIPHCLAPSATLAVTFSLSVVSVGKFTFIITLSFDPVRINGKSQICSFQAIPSSKVVFITSFHHGLHYWINLKSLI